MKDVAIDPPRTGDPHAGTVRCLIDIWSTVLGIKAIRAGDDFLDLGGDSIDAMQVASLMTTRFGVEFPPAFVLEATKLDELAVRVARTLKRGGRRALAIVRCDRSGPVPLSFAQQRMWFLHRLDPDSPTFNIPMLFRVCGTLDVPTLARSMQAIVRRHESLRTV